MPSTNSGGNEDGKGVWLKPEFSATNPLDDRTADEVSLWMLLRRLENKGYGVFLPDADTTGPFLLFDTRGAEDPEPADLYYDFIKINGEYKLVVSL